MTAVDPTADAEYAAWLTQLRALRWRRLRHGELLKALELHLWMFAERSVR